MRNRMVTFLSLFSVAQLVGTAPTAAVQGFSETRMTNRHRPVASIFHNNEAYTFGRPILRLRRSYTVVLQLRIDVFERDVVVLGEDGLIELYTASVDPSLGKMQQSDESAPHAHETLSTSLVPGLRVWAHGIGRAAELPVELNKMQTVSLTMDDDGKITLRVGNHEVVSPDGHAALCTPLQRVMHPSSPSVRPRSVALVLGGGPGSSKATITGANSEELMAQVCLVSVWGRVLTSRETDLAIQWGNSIDDAGRWRPETAGDDANSLNENDLVASAFPMLTKRVSLSD